MSAEANTTEGQLAWPLPPPHYTLAGSLSPPPIPPNDGTYEYLAVYQTPIFETYKTQFQELEEEVTFLFDKNNLKPGLELKKLNMSLLFNFLELVDALKRPAELVAAGKGQTGGEGEGGGGGSTTSPVESIIKNKITPMFKNMHHLLNLYRPHQSRQMLIGLMEKQIERRKAFLKSIDEHMDRSEKILQKAKRKITLANAAANPTTLQNPAGSTLRPKSLASAIVPTAVALTPFSLPMSPTFLNTPSPTPTSRTTTYTDTLPLTTTTFPYTISTTTPISTTTTIGTPIAELPTTTTPISTTTIGTPTGELPATNTTYIDS